MKFKIDDLQCKGCGLCERICPQVFRMRSDRLVKIAMNPVPEDLKTCALRAAEVCPLKIIHLV